MTRRALPPSPSGNVLRTAIFSLLFAGLGFFVARTFSGSLYSLASTVADSLDSASIATVTDLQFPSELLQMPRQQVQPAATTAATTGGASALPQQQQPSTTVDLLPTQAQMRAMLPTHIVRLQKPTSPFKVIDPNSLEDAAKPGVASSSTSVSTPLTTTATSSIAAVATPPPQSPPPQSPPPPAMTAVATTTNTTETTVARASESGQLTPQQQLFKGLFVPRYSPPAKPPKYDPVVMTPGQPNRLSKEYITKLASKDGYVLLAKSNLYRVDFALNWAYHLHALGIYWYTIMATSKEAYDALLGKGVNAFLADDAGIQQDAVEWGSPMFNKLSAQHVKVLCAIAEYGFVAFYSDTDAVWLRDPSPFLAANTAVDIALSSDALRPSRGSNDLMFEDPHGFAHTNLNIGMMMVRPTPAAVALLRYWYEILAHYNGRNELDQVVFAKVVRQSTSFTNMSGKPLPQNTWKGWGQNVSIAVLPIAYFSTGHTFFIGQWYHRLHSPAFPYIMHSTFTFAAHDGKRHRLRDAHMWLVDGEEYFAPGSKGFLYYEPDIPDGMVRSAVPANPDPPQACRTKKEGMKLAMDLIHYQIQQLRSAYQIAQLTGRTLVLPPFVCTYDRWYGCHDGSIPGAGTELPIICPFDYIFEVGKWNQPLDEERYGPNIAYRESSFFDNPRFDRRVLQESKVTVTTDGAVCARAGAGACLSVSPDMDEGALLTELNKVSNFSVLKLDDPVKIFRLYKDSINLDQFQKRFQELTALWCCVREEKPGGPGHIFYDPFYDIDHVDKVGRTWKANEWRPLLGDSKN